MFKKSILAALSFYLMVSIVSAERYAKRPSFDETSLKFVRNMEILESKIVDPVAKEYMKVVIGKARELTQAYTQGGGTYREQLIDLKEKRKMDDNPTSADQRREEELVEKIKDNRKGSQFNFAKKDTKQALSELNKQLDQIFTNDEIELDVIRIIKEHTAYYKRLVDETNF